MRCPRCGANHGSLCMICKTCTWCCDEIGCGGVLNPADNKRAVKCANCPTVIIADLSIISEDMLEHLLCEECAFDVTMDDFHRDVEASRTNPDSNLGIFD